MSMRCAISAGILRKRELLRLLSLAILPGLSVLGEGELNAQPPPPACTTVGYLQQIPLGFPRSNSRQPTYAIPFDPTNTWVGAGTYDFNLPGYGRVSATINPYPGTIVGSIPPLANYVPQLTWGLEGIAQLKTTTDDGTCLPPATYNWGTDTNFLHFLNTTNVNQPMIGRTDYAITFGFNALSPPISSDLFLVVLGLAIGTNATLNPPANVAPPSLGLTLANGCNAGEHTFPKGSYAGAPSAKTSLPTLANNWNFGNGGGGDPFNTGWDLYKLNSPGLRQLTVGVAHEPGDGIGFTLGYCMCSNLLGNSLDSRDSRIRHLYNINPLNGDATDSRTIGAMWGLAFSPMSPQGVLYAVSQNFGTPVGNALFTVDPTTGAATEVASLAPLVLNGGGLAADPTTGILYLVDGSGNLFTVTGGGTVTRIGRVPGSVQVAAIAIDGSGNLFVVDVGTYPDSLRQVDKTSAAVISSVSLSFHNHQTGFVALAIDPWSGKAYYSEGGTLYTLNLSTGVLSAPVSIIGAEDNGNLASLTFAIGACAPVINLSAN